MRRSAQKPILSWSHAPAKTHEASVSPPRADQKGLGQSKRAFSPSRVMMYHPYVGILTLFGDGSIEKDGWPVKRDVAGPRRCPHSNNTDPNVIAPSPRCDLSYAIEICNLLKLLTIARHPTSTPIQAYRQLCVFPGIYSFRKEMFVMSPDFRTGAIDRYL
jgi:hypothetical protein